MSVKSSVTVPVGRSNLGAGSSDLVFPGTAPRVYVDAEVIWDSIEHQRDANHSGSTQWPVIEVQGGEHEVARNPVVAALQDLHARRSFKPALSQPTRYGVGIAFGRELQPARLGWQRPPAFRRGTARLSEVASGSHIPITPRRLDGIRGVGARDRRNRDTPFGRASLRRAVPAWPALLMGSVSREEVPELSGRVGILLVAD